MSEAQPFTLVSAGHGGVSELANFVDESAVQFALCKFVFGSGAFARTKTLFLHMNGDKCPLFKRGKLNTKKGAAKVRAVTVAGCVHAPQWMCVCSRARAGAGGLCCC